MEKMVKVKMAKVKMVKVKMAKVRMVKVNENYYVINNETNYIKNQKLK